MITQRFAKGTSGKEKSQFAARAILGNKKQKGLDMLGCLGESKKSTSMETLTTATVLSMRPWWDSVFCWLSVPAALEHIFDTLGTCIWGSQDGGIWGFLERLLNSLQLAAVDLQTFRNMT